MKLFSSFQGLIATSLIFLCHGFITPAHENRVLKYCVLTENAKTTSKIKGLKSTTGGYERTERKSRYGNASGRNSRTNRERENKAFREERLQDKLKRQLNKMEGDSGAVSQRTYDNVLALSASLNDWETYEMVLGKMHEQGMMSGKSTFRTILKECYSNGNGISALEVLDRMESQPTKICPDREDLKLAIMALCRNNRYDRGLWKKALQLILLAAAAIESGEMNVDVECAATIPVDAYNDVLQCMEGDKRWEDSMELLALMEEKSGIHATPNLATYHRVLNILVASSRVDVATELLHSMTDRQKAAPSIYSYEIVMSALLKPSGRGRGRDIDWREAVALLESMHENKIIAPTVMFNRVISACAKAKKFEVARKVFRDMKKRNIPADTVTYNALISAATSQGRTKDAMILFDLCKEDTGADIITYTNTIRACARSKRSRTAVSLLEEAKQNGQKIDAFIYTATVDACAKANDWKEALRLLEDMKQCNVLPNEYTYSSAITACGNCGQWKRALELLSKMKEKEMKVSTFTYNAAITALSKGARQNVKGESECKTDKQNLWIKAMALFDEMKSKRIWPDAYTYSSVISTCASGGRYEEALVLIKAMQNGPSRNRPNKIAYTGAISACARAGEFAHALQLFVDMKTARIGADVVACNALMSAFSIGRKPDLAFDLWNDMCGKGSGAYSAGSKNVHPDIITLTSVVASLDKAGGKEYKEKIDVIFSDAVERQIILRSDSMDTKWEIDLSGMSLPVAKAACRFIIRRLLSGKDDKEYNDLNLITGVGRHHHENALEEGSTALREYVQDILQNEFDPPIVSEIPERAAGVVLVKKASIETWMAEVSKRKS